MGFFEIILISVGLAMDAFAVAICKGLSIKRATLKKAITIGLYFGIFQAGMPILGYFIGNSFQEFVLKITHIISFILLSAIGANMLKEAFSKKDDDEYDDKMNFKSMIILAIATSIDALAIGITFAFLNVNMSLAVASIGIITFILSAIGFKIGNKFGNKYESKSQIAGGVILILLGIKLLLEHI